MNESIRQRRSKDALEEEVSGIRALHGGHQWATTKPPLKGQPNPSKVQLRPVSVFLRGKAGLGWSLRKSWARLVKQKAA
ncbi:hypothetical protein ACKKBG_A16275 [Auxenochlorella protothecoides x Auxenochlorella symbiontica]